MAGPEPDAIISRTLASALVESSHAPVILLDTQLNVIAVSASFSRAFDLDMATVSKRSVFHLGKGEWDIPQLRSLLDAITSGHTQIESYEIDLKRPGSEPRRLVVNAQKLEYGDTHEARILLTISDITDARTAEKLKDDLIQEKAILLQEVQHRVANSLQIIASVLMQSARRVQSDEIRNHLQDAHHRVMSISTLQRQLAITQIGQVALRPYFTQLCQSIGASMIRDPEQISLQVVADDSLVEADVSVSLGLIVTELVINALKHAFLEQRHGTIIVGYKSTPAGWTLSISDDGIGPPVGDRSATPGLGTNIVQALAKHLRADVVTARSVPGMIVSIEHRQEVSSDISDARTAA